MFGLRYHVASLAAVFLALAVGILLGVAISGKVSEVGERAERDRLSNLEQDVGEANERADAAERSGEAARELVESAYPSLMANRLDDLEFALFFLGPVDGNVRSAVERTLFDAGAGGPAFMIALDIPLEPDELQSAIEGNDLLAGFADDGGDFGDLGRELGEEVIAGGDTPLWDTLQSELVQERTGAISAEVDRAVVMYSWTPPGSEGEEDAHGTFLSFEGVQPSRPGAQERRERRYAGGGSGAGGGAWGSFASARSLSAMGTALKSSTTE